MYCNKCPILKNAVSLNLLSSEDILDENNMTNWSSTILLSNYTNFNYNEIENLIVFGDSHSAIGTNYTDMTYTGRNHSGGKNWPLYLKEFNNMKLWNYAKSSAPIHEKIYYNRTIDLKMQYNYFNNNTSKGNKFYKELNKNNSLFIFWFGTIDIGFRKYNYETVEELAENFFNIIEKMYDSDAINIMILGAPPLYRIPSRRHFNVCKGILDENCIKYLKNEVLTFNNEIIKNLKNFFKNIQIQI